MDYSIGDFFSSVIKLFALLTPPYEDAKRVTVDQFNTKMDNSKFVTGKRLDYDFDVEDI